MNSRDSDRAPPSAAASSPAWPPPAPSGAGGLSGFIEPGARQGRPARHPGHQPAQGHAPPSTAGRRAVGTPVTPRDRIGDRARAAWRWWS
ncbi:MAG: hypothetical protein MZW92_12130 [Comamonadaceae bacterium]|nr:hypothetical protein [Comamonadaceae bacterium]